MKKIVLVALAMVVCLMAVGCNEESAGRPSAFDNKVAKEAAKLTGYDAKNILASKEQPASRLTGSDAKNILATKPIEKTPAMKDRNCAILYDTASRHELALQKDGQDFDRKMAINSYELYLEECPDSPHAEQARLAVKDLGAQIRK